MRLRNVKNAKQIIEASKYAITNPKEHRGHYRQLFENTSPIHLEIGMGKGSFILGNALAYPNINYIGLEKFDSVLVRAINKIDQHELSNLRLMSADATYIDEIFDHEIDTVYLNFSDPWPKERHRDRRLTSKLFLEKYDHIFTSVPNIIMKTDNRHLFEYSLISLVEFGYNIEAISLDLYKEDISKNIQTEYEKRFSDKGETIYYLKVSKN